MRIDDETCYRALAARDVRFDGLFFVGVTSTGVYCRPVCTARRVGRGRCRFFSNSALAERQGFRPCLRCRPELAPGHASVDAVSRTACAAARRIEAGALNNGGKLERLAQELGLGGASFAAWFKRSTASRQSSWPKPSACCWPSNCSPNRICRSPRSRSPAASKACAIRCAFSLALPPYPIANSPCVDCESSE